MSVGRALGAGGVGAAPVAAWLPNLLFGLGGATLWLAADRGGGRRRPWRLARVQAA